MKRFVYVFAVIVSTGLLLVVYLLYRNFRIATIVIISQESKMNGLSLFNNKNILLIDPALLTPTLMRLNPLYKDIKIVKLYPNKLSIFVEQRIPIATVSNGISTYLTDRDGVVLPLNNQYGELPAITISAPIIPNSKPDWRIKKALEFLEKYQEQSIFIHQIIIDDTAKTYTFKTNEDSLVLVPYDRDPWVIATSLQTIISRFRIEGKFVSNVDFRFDKPIAVLSTGEKISSNN